MFPRPARSCPMHCHVVLPCVRFFFQSQSRLHAEYGTIQPSIVSALHLAAVRVQLGRDEQFSC